tara:strand:- start:42 stop:347 length:306 start_codon:yes stop_codon:yes gene_type:complete
VKMDDKEPFVTVKSFGNDAVVDTIKKLHEKDELIWVPGIGHSIGSDSELFLHRVDDFLEELEEQGYLEKRGTLDNFSVYRLSCLENGHTILTNYEEGKKLK